MDEVRSAPFKIRGPTNENDYRAAVLMVNLTSLTPVYAETAGAKEKTLSYIEFSEQVSHHGFRGRVLGRRYEEYRSRRAMTEGLGIAIMIFAKKAVATDKNS